MQFKVTKRCATIETVVKYIYIAHILKMGINSVLFYI